MTDKKQIIIDGVDVSGCKHYKINGKCRIPHYQQGIKYVNCNCNEWNCYFKQFQKEKFENLNNRQMVERAENLIYENSELIKNLKEKEQECEELKKKYEALKLENQEGYEIVAELEHEYEKLKSESFTSESLISMQEKDIDRYRKVLEEIEKYAKENDEMLQGYHHEWANNRQILEIINKAKSDEAE